MAELADALDSGSSVLYGRGGSNPLTRTVAGANLRSSQEVTEEAEQSLFASKIPPVQFFPLSLAAAEFFNLADKQRAGGESQKPLVIGPVRPVPVFFFDRFKKWAAGIFAKGLPQTLGKRSMVFFDSTWNPYTNGNGPRFHNVSGHEFAKLLKTFPNGKRLVPQREGTFGAAASVSWGFWVAYFVAATAVCWLLSNAMALPRRRGRWRRQSIRAKGPIVYENDSPSECQINVTHYLVRIHDAHLAGSKS